MRRSALTLVVCLASLLLFTVAFTIQAQTPAGTLRGQVTDPSGAVVAGATIVVKGPTGSSVRTKSNTDGIYEFRNLAPGKYELRAAAEGFAVFTNEGVEIAANQTQKLDISLTIAMEEQKVEVSDSSTQLDVNPAANAGAIILTGKDLEALSDDPDELAAELQALAGPSAGPNGGQIYIDGFTAGQLPPKSSIREIRINQNPFSAEYDKLGYGRIEIFTKPGTD